MQRFLDYSVPYTKASNEELKKRNQQYDRPSQHISICNTPRIGHHVPFLVKFPVFSTWFGNLPPQTYLNKYRAGSPGVFNGLYFFPDGKNPKEFKVPDVVAAKGTLNLTQKFLETEKYKLLQHIGQRVIDNLDIQRHGYIDLKMEPADFRSSEQLLARSKIFNELIHVNIILIIFQFK